MELFHSTKSPNKFSDVKNLKFKKNKKFNYSKYIEYLIEEADLQVANFPGSYPRAPRQCYFLGEGLYCFDELEAARNYQTNATIIKLNLKEDIEILDLNDLAVLEMLDEYLTIMTEFINEKFINEPEIKKQYIIIIKILKRNLVANFTEIPITASIVLYFYFEFATTLKYVSNIPDVIKCSFRVNTNSEIYYCIKKKANLIDPIEKL